MIFTIDPFTITVSLNRKSYTFKAEQTYLSANIEIFTLTYQDREIQIQTNRPFVRKDWNNRKKIEWKVLNGKVEHKKSLEEIKQELERYIKGLEHPTMDWRTNPKNLPY